MPENNKKILVISPTYNERLNVENLLARLHKAVPAAHILVVDDNSPDGTGDYVKKRSKSAKWINVLQRSGKLGLGTAYCDGFRWALDHKYDYIIQMDADLSHNPDYLPDMLEAIEDHDLVIGSRYLKGVNVVNWPLSRLILSWCANVYAKLITGVKVWDLTGGFKCWRSEVLANLEIETITSEGYSFQIETTFRANRQGYRIKEVPIVFVDRTEGDSKMSGDIIWEAVWLVISLKAKQVMEDYRNRRTVSGEAGNSSQS